MPAGWIEGGVALVGAAESIDSNQNAKSAAKQNNADNAVTRGAQNTMLNDAQSIASQPFQAYTGDLTAPLSGNEQQGVSLASKTANTGLAQEDNSKATGLIDQVAGNNWNSDTAQKYMNPYTQAVTDAATAAENKTYLQNLAGLQTRQAGSNAFGGSRAAIGQATLSANHAMNVGSLTATGNANAYDNAMKAWQADNQTKLSASDAYEKAGMDVTQMTSQQISDLMKTGGVAQVIAQTDLNNQYGQFMRQQNWASDKLQPLIQSIGATKGGVAQSPAVQSNTANQLLGLGSTLAGLFGGGSSSAGSFSSMNDASNTSIAGGIPDYTPILSGDAAGQGASSATNSGGGY